MDLHTRIEKVLSEILSDMHECKITLHFEKKEETEDVPRVSENTMPSKMPERARA